MELDRRTFLILPAAAALTGAAPASTADASIAAAPQIASGAVVGARRLGIHRIGQLNMTEHDPVALDVEAWADYWASLKVDVVLVSVTGILAFYQTKVPFHRKGKYPRHARLLRRLLHRREEARPEGHRAHEP